MKNQKRYRLSEDEWRLIDDYRQDKENKALLEEECNEAGIDVGSVHHYWYKSKKFSIFAKPNSINNPFIYISFYNTYYHDSNSRTREITPILLLKYFLVFS